MAISSLFGSLCIRADAGPDQGIGHVMRCLALAQAWQDRGGTAIFVTATESPSILSRIRAEGCAVHPLIARPASPADADETRTIAATIGASWVVVDGYNFPRAYVETLRTGDWRLLVIDDLANADCSPADLVVNPNLQASVAWYPGRTGSRSALAGSRFALLRREFIPGLAPGGIPTGRTGLPVAVRDTVSELVVALGGSDPPNATSRILEIMDGFRDWRLRITVIVGPASPHLAALHQVINGLQAGHDVHLLVDPPDLAPVMARADLAISGAGTSSWELASLGVPLALVIVADNQRAGAEALAAQDLAVVLGSPGKLQAPTVLEALRPLLTGAERRQRLATGARALIDGRGAARVAERVGAYPLALRPAVGGDAKLLHGWANDPLTRRMSFSTELIPWDTHVDWLARRLADPDCRLSIAEDENGQPVGQARLERNGTCATLSVSVAANCRGRGYAARLVRLAAVDSLLDDWCDSVDAWVRPENVPSVAAFRRAGFSDRGVRPQLDPPDPSPGALLFRLA